MRTILSLALLLAPSTALAQKGTAPTPSVSTMADDDCARARKLGKTCVLTIDDEELTAQVPQNTGEKITAINWGKMTSLITVRRDFIPEIVKSAEDID